MNQAFASAPIDRAAPGKAPTAFLIWPSGEVNTDLGVFQFTDRSAALLMADQAARNVKFAFDLDHLSMRSDLPEHARRAVGWHRIEIRDGALWATECEWAPHVREGLEAKPPSWRYYSPVFNFDPETREILRYMSCALTNSPATHGATDLALAARAPTGQHALAASRVAYNAKTNTLTLGQRAYDVAKGDWAPEPGWQKQISEIEAQQPTRSKETAAEVAQRRDRLDRAMGLGRYAPSAERHCVNEGRIMRLGVRVAK